MIATHTVHTVPLIDMPPTRALALALLVLDEHIDFMPVPTGAKERQAMREWLAEVQAARCRIAEMIGEMGGQREAA